MRKTIAFIILVTVSINLLSQNKALSLYSFDELAGNFSSINTTGTALIPNDWDDGCSDVTDIGFNFNYNDVVYTQFSVNTNGTVNLGNQTIDEETNNLESEEFTNLLAPLWDDLKFYNSGTDEGIFYSLDLNGSYNILTIEYYNVGRYNSTGQVSFQVKIFEEDNHIEFIYGDLSGATNWSETSTTSIGMNADGTPSTEFISVTPNATDGATISSEIENDIIQSSTLAEIAIGTTYKFTPPSETSDIDIAITDINSPNSNFLTNEENIHVDVANLGIEITGGLSFICQVFNSNTGTQIGSSITENYTDYPINALSVFEYSFENTLDLSDNFSYTITVELNIDNDVNLDNNQLSKNVNGILLDPIIFNNGEIVTETGTGTYGSDLSIVQTSLNMWNYGYNTSWIIGYRNADEFVVPEGEVWTISGFGFYNWQTNSDTISTINHLDFRVFNGLPAEEATDTLFDFYDINKLTGSKWAGIFRVYDSEITNTDRPIMLSVATFDETEEIILEEGVYWLDWSSGGTGDNGPWTPFITEIGVITTGDAWHLGYEGWVNWIEDGTNAQQGMPFMIYGNKEITNIIENKSTPIVYPNPNKGIFKIDIKEECILNIYTVNGQKIISKNYSGDEIDLSTQNSGIYLIELIYKDRIEKMKTIINK